MNALLPAVRRFLDQKALASSFGRLLQRSARTGDLPKNPYWDRIALQALSPDDRDVMNRALKAGLAERLKPGTVDALAHVPELALGLIRHGAVPTDRFLDEVGAWAKGDFFSGFRWNPSGPPDGTPGAEPRGLMGALLFDTASRHPGLDWLAVETDDRDPEFKAMRTVRWDLTFTGLLPRVLQARQDQGLPMGPMNAEPLVYDGLLNETLDSSSSRWAVLYPFRKAWVRSLVEQGGNPNGRHARPGGTDLCLLARALHRTGASELVEVLLASGAVVTPQVLGEMALVMHDPQEQMGGSRSEAPTAFELAVAAQPEALNLDAVVPSSEYGAPTLGFVLKKHYPDLFDRLTWKNNAQSLDLETPRPGRTQARSRL